MIPLIDIFAGPGGLSEGFSSIRNARGDVVFASKAAIEMESSAVSTLKLRSAFRLLERDGSLPDSYFSYLRGEISRGVLFANRRFAEAHDHVSNETHEIELGPLNHKVTDRIIANAVGDSGRWALIGGPPCQAYSLVGRSRRKNDLLFEEDKKHFLYREYLHTIRRFKPTVFVMENVKGLLSSTHGGTSMFDRILEDLREADEGIEYDIYSFVNEGIPTELNPKDFVIRAEQFGVPQRRHRVILLGVRKDLGRVPRVLKPWLQTNTVRTAIGDMPLIRSIISRSGDSEENWLRVRDGISKRGSGTAQPSQAGEPRFEPGRHFMQSVAPMGPLGNAATGLSNWLTDDRVGGVVNHMSRRHMAPDLERYYFASTFALEEGRSPRLGDLPPDLLPAHRSATTEVAAFVDRFNVQLWDRPSSTIVSHMAKDGNYYIHPDPHQMRSLTVREAARLQTFPDNYLFEGTQTQQYVQVGNAVPPLLAKQIGEIVRDLLESNEVDAKKNEVDSIHLKHHSEPLDELVEA